MIDNFISFDKEETDFIESKGFILRGQTANFGSYIIHYKRIKKNEFPPFNIITEIYKTKDEWYYVMLDSSTEFAKFYKCDQFDGLTSLLNKILKYPNH